MRGDEPDSMYGIALALWSAPRMRGDEPNALSRLLARLRRAPRMRGDEPYRSVSVAVLPACAGMNRDTGR